MIHVRSVVRTGDRAAWRAGLLSDKLPPDVVHRVARERRGRIPALLRAVVHQAIFADVKISGSGAATPVVLFSVRDIVLERIEFAVAAAAQLLGFEVNRALLFG